MKKGQAACCRRNLSSLLHIYSAFDNPAGLMNILCDFFSVSLILSSCQAWDLTSSSLIFFPSDVHFICYFPSAPPPTTTIFLFLITPYILHDFPQILHVVSVMQAAY